MDTLYSVDLGALVLVFHQESYGGRFVSTIGFLSDRGEQFIYLMSDSIAGDETVYKKIHMSKIEKVTILEV